MITAKMSKIEGKHTVEFKNCNAHVRFMLNKKGPLEVPIGRLYNSEVKGDKQKKKVLCPKYSKCGSWANMINIITWKLLKLQNSK